MSWQEELRKLDEELAAGQISADDYRVRRDQVLSSAVSSPEPGHSAATQFVAPVQPPQQPMPQPSMPQPSMPQMPQMPPPPHHTGPQPIPAQYQQPHQQPHQQPGQGEADRTQVVHGDADRTQAVGGWQTARPQGEDADRTQVVPGVPPQAYAAGMQPRPAPPPGQGQSPFPPHPSHQGGWHSDDPNSPWAGSDFPPLAPTGSPDWVRQGPEVFEDSGGPKKGMVAVIIAGVLVVAILGFGVWWFATRDDQSAQPNNENPPATATPTSTAPSGPPRPLAGVDGQIDSANSGPITVAQASDKHQFSPDEAAILGECEAREGQTEVLYQEKWYTLVHVFRCGDRAAQDASVTKLLTQQEAYGFKSFKAPKNLSGMIIENATDVPDAPVDARVFYASGDSIVRVEVRGHTATDVSDGLSEVLNVTTKNFPAK